jgi:inhibitor of cysteine peptidase
MHPLAKGRLLGIGFDAIDKGSFAVLDGVQISLFDTSDPTNLARLDNHVLGKRGSGSDVTGNHHAFYYDEPAKLIGVPVVTVSQPSFSRFNSDERVEFSGAVMYRLEADKIREIARLSHVDLMPQMCRNRLQGSWSWQGQYQSLDINRLYTVDGRLLSISRFGIKAHSLDDPSKVTQSVSFIRVDNEICQ